MSFTTSVFIRKNTPELCKKLEEFGYTPSELLHRETLLTIGDMFFSISKNITDKISAIDCGTNEQLFLAVAALRDDSDHMQWFWYKGRLFLCSGTGSTICMGGAYSLRLIIGKGFFETMNYECRKATVEELITHFKNKE